MPAPEVEPASRAWARAARVATAVAFASQGLVFSVLVTHLPQFTDEYGLSQGAISLVVLAVVVVAGAGSVVSELVAARTSSRLALRCGLAGVAVTAAGIGLAPGMMAFLAAFVAYGIALGVVDAAGNMQGVAVQHVYGRSIIASLHASWSAAAIAGALYVAACERFGVPLAASILAPAVLVLVASFAAGPRFLARDQPPATDGATGVVPAGGRVSLVPGSRVLLRLSLAMACFWAVDSAVSNWSALFLDDVLHAPGAVAPLGYALYQAAALLSRLGGDAVVRRRGAPATVRAASVVGTLGTLVVVLAPSPAVAVAGFGFVGLGLPLLAPLCFAAAADAVRRARPADPAAVDRAIARLNVFNYVGALAGAVLVGAIATAGDLRVAFVLTVLLAAALFWLAGAFAVNGPRTPPTAAPERTSSVPPTPS